MYNNCEHIEVYECKSLGQHCAKRVYLAWELPNGFIDVTHTHANTHNTISLSVSLPLPVFLNCTHSLTHSLANTLGASTVTPQDEWVEHVDPASGAP